MTVVNVFVRNFVVTENVTARIVLTRRAAAKVTILLQILEICGQQLLHVPKNITLRIVTYHKITDRTNTL